MQRCQMSSNGSSNGCRCPLAMRPLRSPVAKVADSQMPAAQRGLDQTEAERLESLARQFRPALRRYFARRARQRADVDDLVQDVLVRLAVRGDCASIAQPEAYLMRTATNVWRDYLRKKETHAEDGHEEYTEGHVFEDHGPDDEVSGIQSVGSVLASLDELPERTRQVFVLCRVEGIRQKNVAKRLGVSVSAVEKHMIRAIAHVATSLRDRGYETSWGEDRVGAFRRRNGRLLGHAARRTGLHAGGQGGIREVAHGAPVPCECLRSRTAGIGDGRSALG